MVLEHCPGVEKVDFTKYTRLGEGRDLLFWGFHLHIHERKLHSIFIFNRHEAQKKQLSQQPLDAPNVRIWLEFLSLCKTTFARDTDSLYNASFQPRLSHERVPYTFADIIFSIKVSRAELKTRILLLASKCLLPQHHPQSPHHRKTPVYRWLRRWLQRFARPIDSTRIPSGRQWWPRSRAGSGILFLWDEEAHPHRHEVFAFFSLNIFF